MRRSEEEERSRKKPSIRELTEQLERRKRKLKRRKAIEEPPSVLEQSVRGESEKEEMIISDLLWIPALLLYGFGDIVTSFVVFGLGGTESNPLLRTLIELGGGLFWFVLLKAAILVVLCLISYGFVERKWRWFIPAALTGGGVYLVILNVSTILRLT